MGNNVDILL